MIPFGQNLQPVEPDTLLEQCVRFAVNHITVLATIDPNTRDFRLKKGLTLPSTICEILLEIYQSSGYVCDDKFVTLFKNPDAAHLKRIKLRNSTISDEGLRILLKSCPIELDLQNCTKLTKASLDYINQYGSKLVSLSLGSSLQVLPHTLLSFDKDKKGYILNTPNLKKLTVRKLYIPEEKMYFPLMLRPLKKLTHFDLSGCFILDNLSYLVNLPHLTSLILFNVPTIGGAIQSLTMLKNLRHLDVSQLTEYGTFKNPNETLALLVESLPNLVSLDISGTNLAGTGVADPSLREGENCTMTDIPGLKSRVNNPLEFLGLYRTYHEACKRHNIPAKKVTGDANEEQTINALQAYIDRKDILIHVLNDLFHLCRIEECYDMDLALSLLVEAMDRYFHERVIQTSGSAISFFMAKLIRKRNNTKIKLKRRLIRSLINAMSAFQDDLTIARNVFLALIHFDLPKDVMFDYDRLALLLALVVAEVQSHETVESREVLRYGVFVLNALACQVDEGQRKLLGNLGTVERMLSIIHEYLENDLFDEVLEVAWSTLWNVTDETHENCERFILKNGMELFLGCLEKFPRREELLRNMMGLLGNVAEMKSLRPHLMTERFIPIFTDLLGSYCDGIEVSYNAAGVLVHICSDGEKAWTVSKPKRKDVLKKIVRAIRNWDLVAQRNINYRSFHPIFGLLKVNHTEACKFWGVWALANLTTVYKDRYCPLVLKEGGIELLETVSRTKHKIPEISRLAAIVLKNCEETKMR